ncbi:alanine--tRNA ligase [Candidatus Pantoea edessiphila]|uniref:Alanine--tRNA ligase n=1 Tax=Candidatus Pantoea edessiphila TaxID=2044610 RepID=A0A2P5SXM8_9GAMM|nr:alanine--tRNA ligase [Candidatus Pantoea edessiphila]MBK4775672.1 alanine--tRNA ligase [Pantoea sp. Edef]PPI87097.1 alanine--tRNA ligase [Candidatus Pantoea edessiphila]
MIKSTNMIRQMFIDFFRCKGHVILPSSSLVPDNDTSLLFTNAGMNQFKNIFLCREKTKHLRVATSQRCIRAGGKHNDLEHVGYTERHNTFFEMLGNFSFGDYFKREAILFAWELLTHKSWFNIPINRFLITVYKSDKESYNIWTHEIGIPKNRIIIVGDQKNSPYVSDNFWQMGDDGPCGPCTEILYYYGNNNSCLLNSNMKLNDNNYLELWNIVFLQFDRQPNGSMIPLSKPFVDTGMGLERIASVMQHVKSNYKIDLFKNLILRIAEIIGTKDINHSSLRVIADHIRSCAFLIADGILPSNENRGYVLRRIIRRAIRHGNILGAKKFFLHLLIKPLIEIMGEAAEYLSTQQIKIENILKFEEEQFNKTLKRGLLLLNFELSNLKENSTLSGKTMFRLHDTFGFPVDLIKDICKERNYNVDNIGFEKEMKLQQIRARQSSKFESKYNNEMFFDVQSCFKGYDLLHVSSVIKSIYISDQSVENISTLGDHAIIILDTTPFYAESGGQIGDIGSLTKQDAKFSIKNTKKYGKTIYHEGILLSGEFSIGDICNATVDFMHRKLVSINHSATHLLHAALCKILGNHVVQKGSSINDKYFRFDFLHYNPLTLKEIYKIEEIVNENIFCNINIETKIMSIDEAKLQGAKMLFKEKYNHDVRVIQMGTISTELCGGTHVLNTSEIGLFCIKSECGVSSGIRRLEVNTSKTAFNKMNDNKKQLNILSDLMKTNINHLNGKICDLINHTNSLEREIQNLRNNQVNHEIKLLINNVIDIKGSILLVSKINNFTESMLNNTVIKLKNQLSSSIIVLATITDDKILLIASVTKDLTNKIQANHLIDYLAKQIGGKGGGKVDLARAGGNKKQELDRMLLSVKPWVSSKL